MRISAFFNTFCVNRMKVWGIQQEGIVERGAGREKG
jgi:hypothetical protein